MNINNLKGVIEALIFVSDRPLSFRVIREVLGENGAPEDDVRRCLQELAAECQARGGAVVLEEVGEGYQFRTRPEFAPWLKKLVRSRPLRLTKPALDVLSIVAYKQPVTRHEIEAIRGVDSGGVLEHLLQKKLVAIAGKKAAPGHPIIYKTTQEFLEVFNLKDLKDLPTLREYKDIAELGDLEPAARSLLERMESTAPAQSAPQPPPPGAGPSAPGADAPVQVEPAAPSSAAPQQPPNEPPAQSAEPAAPPIRPDQSQEPPSPSSEPSPDPKKE